MVSWSEPTKITEGVAAVMRFLRRRQWEEIAIVLGVASIWVGCSFAGWLTDDLKKRLEAGQALMLIQAALVIAGALSFGYGAARSWRLVSRAEEPPVTIRPSAIKGPDAFTEADGGLFSKLGREKELRQLLHHVLNDQTAMIILLGASGAGKTSLLRAGLTHALVGSGVRYHYWEAVPSDSCERLLRTLQVTWSAGGTEPGQSTRSLAALGELINPAPELCRVPHVIVIDQFEQLRADNPLFDLLRKVARDARPPHRVTWVIAFRGDFRASWSDFIVPEQDRGFYPKELPLQLFTPSQARAAIVQLLADAAINIEHAVVDRLIEATTVDGKVSPVDIGVGLLVVAELHERHAGKTLTERDYHFAGGAEGLLTQYVERCLSRFPDRDRPTLLKTLLALQDPRTEQRLTEGLTATQLGQRLEEDATVLGRQLQRLAQRDMRLVEPLEQAKEATPYRLPHERMIAPLR
ncbi:MAG TPA: ATP-binding protein, partial [Polyangiaceae bacterium]|nr:ATP-binding protein [Polyangiaceae bacterium]